MELKFLVFQAIFAETLLVHSVLIRWGNPTSLLVSHSSREKCPITCQVLLQVESVKFKAKQNQEIKKIQFPIRSCEPLDPAILKAYLSNTRQSIIFFEPVWAEFLPLAQRESPNASPNAKE